MTLLASSAAAQVRLPALPLPNVLQTVPQSVNQAGSNSLDRVSELRLRDIDRLIRAHRQGVDRDPNGEPVIRDEVLAFSPTPSAEEGARALGFRIDREQRIGSLDVRLVVFKAPAGLSAKKALRALREADPGGTYDYNHIYTGGGALSTSGAVSTREPETASGAGALDGSNAERRARVGLVDTGVDITHPVFQSAAVHTWGCENRMIPADHGTAVASLLVGRAAAFHGTAPEAELYAADVYCGLPTGGAVDALVSAFDWLVQEKVAVINVSLVGPKNALLERVVAALIGAGYVIDAAVGNDGPAAPPLYPASYPQVVGVTAVDARRRVLIEAARGPQVMFAAPGADTAAANAVHAFAAVRGTSFAAPIVAGLLAYALAEPGTDGAAAAIDALAKTAIHLGSPGRDLTYGYGLVGAEFRNDPPNAGAGRPLH